MLNLVNIIENIHKIDFNIFKTKKKNISFLKSYKKDKILLIGYEKNIYNYDNISLKKESEIISNIDNYTLFVINKAFCKLSRESIQRLIDIFKNKNKKVIFCGYSSYLNLNIDNSIGMVRPIDITRYPFNIDHEFSVIKKGFAKKFTVTYLLILIFSIFTNIKNDYILYRINLTILISLILLFPYHKYIFIDYSLKK
tara:strand:- start:1394 stop:1984 length:591 start_codon:yes stop_codon:yes gene_type:complete